MISMAVPFALYVLDVALLYFLCFSEDERVVFPLVKHIVHYKNNRLKILDI